MPIILIEDLRKVDGQKTPALAVDGYIRAGDGGGGDFQFFLNDTTPADNGLVFAPDSSVNPPLPKGRWKRNWVAGSALSVRWFGAQGDSNTDDYDALQAAVAAINKKQSNILRYPKGIYRIGRVKLTCCLNCPCPPKNDDIVFRGCDNLRLEGENSVIDVMGNFYRADIGISSVQPFVFENCTNVLMTDFELNGNVDKMSRADKNFLHGGSGIVFGLASANYTLQNLFVHHFPNDGIYLGLSDKATLQKPAPCDHDAVLKNVTCNFNARNGLSCISLVDSGFFDCEFSENGRAAGDYGVDAPGLGVDIEPQFYAVPTPGHLTFHNCKCQNNVAGAISITAPSCRFYNCVFWGTGYYSIISAQAGHYFENCQIYGECANRYDPTIGKNDPAKPVSPTNPPHPQFSPEYVGCHFEDKEWPGTGVYRTTAAYGACVSTNHANVVLSNCTVIGNKTRGVQLGQPWDTSQPHLLTQCTITHKMSNLPNNTNQSQLIDAKLDTIHFEGDLHSVPSKIWFIDHSNSTWKPGTVTVDGPWLVWGQGGTFGTF